MVLQLECADCGDRFSSKEELEIHISGEHLNFCPYECEKCRFAKFPTEFALATHCREDHGLTEFYVRYKYTPETEARREQVRARVAASMGRGEDRPPSVPLGKRPRIEDDKTLDVLESQSQLMQAICKLQEQSAPSPSAESFTVDYAALIGEVNESAPAAPEKKQKEVVTCQMCGLKVSNQRSSLVYHANTKHIRLDLYGCTGCAKTWQTIAKSDVLKHVKAVHGGGDEMVIDNRKKLGYQLRLFTAKCFPPSEKRRGRPPLSAGNSPPTTLGQMAEIAHQFGLDATSLQAISDGVGGANGGVAYVEGGNELAIKDLKGDHEDWDGEE